MAKRSSMYKIEKRKKELFRKKKKEEKRLRRSKNGIVSSQESEVTDSLKNEPSTTEDTQGSTSE